MMVSKYYLDTWGPLGSRRVGKAHGVARLTNSKSLRGQVGLTVDIKDFLVGGSSAPFPLMQSLPTHQAQHLLDRRHGVECLLVAVAVQHHLRLLDRLQRQLQAAGRQFAREEFLEQE